MKKLNATLGKKEFCVDFIASGKFKSCFRISGWGITEMHRCYSND